MENIYSVRVKSSPDPRWLYPSERRYSASTVLGLGVVHIAFAFASLLLACVTLVTSNEQSSTTIQNSTNSSSEEEASKTRNFYIFLTLAPCLSCLGALAAGLTGLLAWKRWYVDHNVVWFFFTSVMSTIKSAIAVIIITSILIMVNERVQRILLLDASMPNFQIVVAINILIAVSLELLWSVLSINVAYKGMINDYPDDLVISKSTGGKVEVTTIHKGNKQGTIMVPDVINHFSSVDKMGKVRKNFNLPKEESHAEYQERVNKFLSSNEF